MKPSITRRRFAQWSAAAAAVATQALPARAQGQFPLAHLLCGFPAGDPIDVLTRQIGEKLRGSWAEAVVVDNRPGAGGRIAVQDMKGMAADGSVMLFTPASMLVVYPHVYKSLAYDPLHDVTPVAPVAQVYVAFAVGPMVPESVRTLAQFLAWCRANPDKASYATSSQGSNPHLTAALLADEAKTPMTMVAYRGGALAANDAIAGHIAAAATSHGVLVPHHRAGKLRILAISSPTRLAQLPDVPTLVESGFPDIVTSEWFGVFLPGRASSAVAEHANAAIRAAAQSPEVASLLDTLTLLPASATLPEFTQRVRADYDQWGRVVKALNFSLLD